MKRISLLLMALFFVAACSKDDDNGNDDDNPQNQTSSFNLVSSDDSINLSGNANLLPNFGNDSIITISMTDNSGGNISLALYHEAGPWNVDHFELQGDTANAQTFFMMTMTLDNSSTLYSSISGEIHITDKQEGQFIAGDMNVLLLNPSTSDSLQASGSFHAIQGF